MQGGINRATNAATLGLYGKVIDKYMDNSYSNLQNRLQQQASSAGVGKLNQLVNDGVDWTARGMQATLLSKINKLIK